MHHDAVARVEVDLLHDRAPKTAQHSEYLDDAHAATCLPRVSSPCQLETLGAERRAPSYITLSDPRNPQERLKYAPLRGRAGAGVTSEYSRAGARAQAPERSSPPRTTPCPLTRSDRSHARTFSRYWAESEDAEVRAWVYGKLENASYINTDGALLPWQPNRHRVANVLDAFRAIAHLSERLEPPTWLEGSALPPGEVVACTNGLLHARTRELVELDPRFFQPGGRAVRLHRRRTAPGALDPVPRRVVARGRRLDLRPPGVLWLRALGQDGPAQDRAADRADPRRKGASSRGCSRPW